MKWIRTSAGLGLAITLLFATGCDDDNPVAIHIAPVPAGVFSVTGDAEVELFWSPIREAGVEGYHVYRNESFEGTYKRIGTVHGANNSSFLDDGRDLENGLQNGVSYYYAVASFTAGDVSDLSYEEVVDTPRPQGAGLRIYQYEFDPERSGLDFKVVQDNASYNPRDVIVVPWDARFAAYFVLEVDGLLRMVGTEIELDGEFFVSDIQDFGYTDHLDDIDFAPVDGWSIDPVGVELIEGHTYVLWTWEDYFAKFRVRSVGENSVILDWALQTSDDEFERRQLKNSSPDKRKWNRSMTDG